FNIDDCAANPCVNGACTDGVNSYTCTCTAGWQGTNCDQDINECSATNNCAVCQNLVPSYFCVCEISSYEGILCTWAVIGTTTYRVPATTTTTSRIAAIAICAGLDEGGGFLGEPLAANLPTILTKVVARSTFVSGFMWLNVVRQSGSTWVYGATGTVATTNFEFEANVLDNCAVMRVSDFKWIIVSCTSFTADILCQRAITGKVVSP
uniref:EGF-like domain-containing protein n=1 Tax=Ciona savignyi TaxID=51511 RepID=H2ZD24_CIOSA